MLRTLGEHRGHRVVVRGGAGEPYGQDHAARSGFAQYALVREQITALGPQLLGGVTDDRGRFAPAQHAHGPTGTVVATAVALLLHDTMLAMALVLPLVVVLGNWRRLGSQGIYAATGALFVLTGGGRSVSPPPLPASPRPSSVPWSASPSTP